MKIERDDFIIYFKDSLHYNSYHVVREGENEALCGESFNPKIPWSVETWTGDVSGFCKYCLAELDSNDGR